MVRTGQAARTRNRQVAHAQTRLVNGELRQAAATFTPDAIARRASDRVYRVTGHRIPSNAIFSAMGIRQVNPVAGRGAWLTTQAMDESASTDRRTPDQRRTDAHARRDKREARAASPSVGAMRKTVTCIETDAHTMFRALAEWSAWDEIYFACVFHAIDARYGATGDLEQLSEDLRKLSLMRESSRLWENSTLLEIRAGQITVDRLRALIAAKHKSDVRNGRKQPDLGDFPLWDATAPIMPKTEKVARPVVLTAAAPSTDRAQEIMHGNRYFTRGPD